MSKYKFLINMETKKFPGGRVRRVDTLPDISKLRDADVAE